MISKRLRVSKDNALVEASYRLSLTEMQIILYGIGLINPLGKEFPLSYRIDIARFSQIFDKEHGQIYEEIKNVILKRFWERDFSYIDDKGKVVILRWLTKIVYEDQSGYIEIKFSEEIQPYLHQLKENFTAYYIDHIAKFKSVYSVRLYETSLMHLNKNKIVTGSFVINIDELKSKLDLHDRYDRFSNFKKRVLEPAKKEINKFSDLSFNYRIMKERRKPSHIEFIVHKKQPNLNKQIVKLPTTKVSTVALEKAKDIVIKYGSSFDLYTIENQFYEYMNRAGLPRNIDNAFIGFVKKKVSISP